MTTRIERILLGWIMGGAAATTVVACLSASGLLPQSADRVLYEIALGMGCVLGGALAVLLAVMLWHAWGERTGGR